MSQRCYRDSLPCNVVCEDWDGCTHRRLGWEGVAIVAVAVIVAWGVLAMVLTALAWVWLSMMGRG
jgi:hypothetical protein